MHIFEEVLSWLLTPKYIIRNVHVNTAIVFVASRRSFLVEIEALRKDLRSTKAQYAVIRMGQLRVYFWYTSRIKLHCVYRSSSISFLCIHAQPRINKALSWGWAARRRRVTRRALTA